MWISAVLKCKSVVLVSIVLLAITPREARAGADHRLRSADRWCWEHPLPQGNTLGGTWARSPRDAWFVGDRGTILHWDGSSVTRVHSGTGSFCALSGGPARALYGRWATGAPSCAGTSSPSCQSQAARRATSTRPTRHLGCRGQRHRSALGRQGLRRRGKQNGARSVGSRGEWTRRRLSSRRQRHHH